MSLLIQKAMKEDNIQLRVTGDGSHTLFNMSLGEPYHSLFGALNESRHVFIEAGLHEVFKRREEVRVLEIGFGTGLNLLLTCLESGRRMKTVDYIALEAYPLDSNIARELNYPEVIREKDARDLFERSHQAPWNKRVSLADGLNLLKVDMKLEDFKGQESFVDLIYFDAFSPDIQPDLWTSDIFGKLARMAVKGCVLVTYSAKGQVRRNLQQAGFNVERLPGPKGKREMLRAVYG